MFTLCVYRSFPCNNTPKRTTATGLIVMGESATMPADRQASTFDDSTELMSTNSSDIFPRTTGSGMESWSSRGIYYYFQCAVLVMGIIGTASNGLILYALVASKQHKKQTSPPPAPPGEYARNSTRNRCWYSTKTCSIFSAACLWSWPSRSDFATSISRVRPGTGSA